MKNKSVNKISQRRFNKTLKKEKRLSMDTCARCGDNLINIEKTFCPNCGAKIGAEATEINKQKYTACDDGLASGRVLLLIVGIAYIVIGSLGTVWALIGLFVAAGYGDLHVPLPSGMSWKVYYAFLLLRSCLHISVGIIGVINRKRLQKASLLRVLGCIDIGFIFVRMIFNTAFLSFSTFLIVLSVIIGSIFPILYIIGAARNLREYRNNQNCHYYKNEIKYVEHGIFKHIGFLIGLIILTFTLSGILNVGIGNTWLGLVYINATGLVIVKMLWDIATFFKEKHFHISRLCIFFSAMVVIGLIVHNIYFFT